jgi:hypothetical protein
VRKKLIVVLPFAAILWTTSAYGALGCTDLLSLQAQIKTENEQYNKLTGNRQAAQRQQLKAEIAQAINNLNTAFANCGTCGQIAPLQAQIKADYATYNQLTGNRQAAERQQLKAKIQQEQNELPQLIAACPPCQLVATLQAQIKADYATYNQLTGKKQAQQKQQLKAKIIAEEAQLTQNQPGCIVPLGQ